MRNLVARMPVIEWLTLAIAVLIYAGWIALTAFHAQVPLPVLIILGGWLVAWQGSLQHETIHGHPTGVAWIDGAIGFAPCRYGCRIGCIAEAISRIMAPR
ncbi:hypothetical protein QP178_12295 [Sphingomonas aurantiaca]|uniref:hypothetical protein n=1 Tax=Sphingomonas aurantiaca TaxID=185949 RepID=UPI002FE172AA